MFAVCTPSQLSLAGDMSNNRHLHLSAPYTPQPWDQIDASLDYAQIPQLQQPLAYRPRFDRHNLPPRNAYMASPCAMEPLQHEASANEYPDDPSFEANPDGRLEMGQDEIDAIIRNKRKVRDPKACYACHRRKVKCNRELPCDSCVKRDHPELCSYERPTKRRRIALTSQLGRADSDEIKSPAAQSGPNITVPKEQWERLNTEIQQLREQLNDAPGELVDETAGSDYHEQAAGNVSRDTEDAERQGIYAPSNQMGTMYLGSRSVLAYMMGLGRSKSTQDAARSLLEENILPKLGLDNESVTYPFVDLWSTDNSIKDISGLCGAIPDDNLCREFFWAYRDVACTIYPVVPDPPQFEATLNYMLSNRAKAQAGDLPLDPTNPYGISLSWLALVFAVFASGAQCTRLPAKERELTSQVYTCCSYQALRMSNFMTHPNVETIEASLIIANVLAYNMNPGVAYIFLGMVLRMAFSIGLQMNTPGFSDHENWLRRRVWWALAWQDSHYSISYDRPSASVLCHPDIPYTRGSGPGNRSYAESMYNIIGLTQEIIRDRSLSPGTQMSWNTIQRYTETVASIVNEAKPHLRERSLCVQMTQHLERLALKLHSSYITSELCRPALKETNDNEKSSQHSFQSPTGRRRNGSGSSGHGTGRSPSQHESAFIIAQLRRECVSNLEGTVAAYVELHSLSEFAARSWVGIQRAISAAFLLGTLPEANQEPQVMNLLREFEGCIEKRTTDDPTFDKLDTDGMNEAPHWARSMTKSLNALGKLNATLAGHRAGKYGSSYPAKSDYPTPTSNYPNLKSAHKSQQQRSNLQHQQQLPPLMKQEQYSPGISNMNAPASALGGLNVNLAHATAGGPITPADSTGSGEWNYANLKERGAEYIQPGLWR